MVHSLERAQSSLKHFVLHLMDHIVWRVTVIPLMGFENKRNERTHTAEAEKEYKSTLYACCVTRNG